MPVSEKQRQAACAEAARRERGEQPQNFKDMSIEKLKQWCRAKKLHKK